MRNNPMFPNQPPVTQNPQRAITPNPSGIATLQQYVNPRAPMPNTNTGIPATRKKSSSFDKLPDEVKEIIEKPLRVPLVPNISRESNALFLEKRESISIFWGYFIFIVWI